MIRSFAQLTDFVKVTSLVGNKLDRSTAPMEAPHHLRVQRQAMQNDAETERGHELVTVEMDGNTFRIHRGHITVTQLKLDCHVNPAYVVEQINEGGNLSLLADDHAAVIKGGERFHVRGGGSS